MGKKPKYNIGDRVAIGSRTGQVWRVSPKDGTFMYCIYNLYGNMCILEEVITGYAKKRKTNHQ